MIDKRKILDLLIAHLEEQLRSAEASQQAAQAGATHPEAKQEDPKDTRAIEGQYLARGLAERVESLRESLARCRRLEAKPFGPDEPVAVGAALTVESDAGETEHYFVSPWAAGERFRVGDDDVRIVSPQAPLGAALCGQQLDDAIEVEIGGRARSLEIVWIG